MSEQPKITPDFRAFIISLLEKANLRQETIASYTDEESMVEFCRAFTHKSYSSIFNYEFLEFRGDVVVNFAVVQYLQARFPKVISVKWLTKLKHNLGSKTVLANLAVKADFLKHILYGRGMEDIIRSANYFENVDYLSMMEDTFEAFVGAVVAVVDSKNRRGVGYTVAYIIIKSFYDSLEISLKWENVFDAKSRIKELYDQLKWAFEQNISTRLMKDSSHVATIWGYPLGDRSREPKNKIVIDKGSGPTAQLAQEKASVRALQILWRKYGIAETIPSPYTEVAEEKKSPPKIPEGFKEFIRRLLKQARVNDDSIKLFTEEGSLIEFRLSFVHQSYDQYVNYNLYKYEGITAVDLAIAEYLGVRFPRLVSEKWLTNIKHNIIIQDNLSQFATNSGFKGSM